MRPPAPPSISSNTYLKPSPLIAYPSTLIPCLRRGLPLKIPPSASPHTFPKPIPVIYSFTPSRTAVRSRRVGGMGDAGRRVVIFALRVPTFLLVWTFTTWSIDRILGGHQPWAGAVGFAVGLLATGQMWSWDLTWRDLLTCVVLATASLVLLLLSVFI